MKLLFVEVWSLFILLYSFCCVMFYFEFDFVFDLNSGLHYGPVVLVLICLLEIKVI